MAPISLKKGVYDDLTAELISNITGIDRETQNFKISTEYALSNFKFHRYLDVNPLDVSRSLKGLAEKFTIHSQKQKATALSQLVEKFLASPLSAHDDSLKTDSHFAVLSVLLSLSDSPLDNQYESKAKKVEKVEDEIDWTAYLLAGERQPELGVPIDYEQAIDLDDSDEEFIENVLLTPRKFQRENLKNDVDTGRQLESKGKDHVSQAELSDPTSARGEKVYSSKQTDLVWLQQNVIPSYWYNQTTLKFNISEESMLTSEICSTSANWELFKAKENQLGNLRDGVLLTEKQLVRETLWMLQGLQNTYVYRFDGTKYIPRNEILLSHVSRETLTHFLSSFSEIGTVFVSVKQFVKEVSGFDHKFSKTFKAFGHSVSLFLSDWLRNLSDIEKDIMNDTRNFTLTTLNDEFGLWFHNLRCINQLYTSGVVKALEHCLSPSEGATHLLNTVYKMVCSLDNQGLTGRKCLQVVFPLFIDSIRPYLDDLEKWMDLGILPFTPESEFYIQKDNDVDRENPRYWNESFKIKVGKVAGEEEERAIAPDFLKPLVREILLAGKSQGLLRDFEKNTLPESKEGTLSQDFHQKLLFAFGCKDIVGKEDEGCNAKTQQLPVFDSNILLTLLKENVMQVFEKRLEAITEEFKQHDQKSNSALSDINFGDTFSVSFTKSLHLAIGNKYRKASSQLLALLQTQFNLSYHFSIMRNIFLMESGDTVHYFYSDLFEKASRNEFWQDVSYLNVVMQEALNLHYPNLIAVLSVGFKSPAESRRRIHQVQAIDGISVHYKAPWPVSIILNSEIEAKYNCVFSFLLQVKRALWSLEQLKVSDLRMTEDVKELARSDPELLSVRQYLVLLRMKLSHFVNNLHFYLVTRILHSTSLEFIDRMKDIKDVDEILDVHRDYIDKILDRCLLSRQAGFVKETITRILNLALDFYLKWNKGLTNIRMESLENIDIEFKRCYQYIQSFLNNLVKRGSFIHIEMLAASLEV